MITDKVCCYVLERVSGRLLHLNKSPLSPVPFLPPTDAFLETSDHFPADLLGIDAMKILSFYMLHEKSVSQTREFLVYLISI